MQNKMSSKADVSVVVEEAKEPEKFSNNSEKFPNSAKFVLVNTMLDRFSSGGIMGEFLSVAVKV